MVLHVPIPREQPTVGQDQHGKPWVHPAARDDKKQSSLRSRRQEMDVTFWELLASCPSPACCPVPGMGPVPHARPVPLEAPPALGDQGDPVLGINQSPRVTGKLGG